MVLRIEASRIDPATGQPDPYGVPQIACPARQGDVNPQFTCLTCSCVERVETHQAVDDLGQPFYVADAVECSFKGTGRKLPTERCEFPSLLAGVVKDAPPRVGLGVMCPLLSSSGRFVPVSLERDGARLVPVGNCQTCQFYRGTDRERIPRSPGEDAGSSVICAAP